MKEKIATIILIIVFVGLLILVNGMLKSEENISSIDAENLASTVDIEENVKTTVIDSYSESQAGSEEQNSMLDDSNSEDVVIQVTEANFEEEVLKSDKKVLIDFYADWCGPCKTLSPIVEEVAKENPDLKVVKIDVDSNENLAYKYKTYSIPTLVVIENGEEVNRAVGAIPKNDVLELIK